MGSHSVRDTNGPADRLSLPTPKRRAFGQTEGSGRDGGRWNFCALACRFGGSLHPLAAMTREPEPTLEAVLPLILADYERFEILNASLERFFPDLRTIWVVVRDAELRALGSLIRDSRYRLVPELTVVPEFRFYRRIPGWIKQQLIKLAATSLVQSDFFLTLDADVICAKPVRASDLIKGSRSACFALQENQSVTEQTRWYLGAERILQLPRPGVIHNVTPSVLSRTALIQLQTYLSELPSKKPFRLGRRNLLMLLARLAQRFLSTSSTLRPHLSPWRLLLLSDLGWTEYSLYYSFLEGTGRFDEHHFRAEYPLYSLYSSLWYEKNIARWDPGPVFSGRDPGFFVVVQSNTGISPEAVRAKVGPFLSR